MNQEIDSHRKVEKWMNGQISTKYLLNILCNDNLGMGWVTKENLTQIVSRRKWPPRYYTQTCKTRPNTWSEVKYFSGCLAAPWVHHSSPGAKSVQENKSTGTSNPVVWIWHQNPTHCTSDKGATRDYVHRSVSFRPLYHQQCSDDPKTNKNLLQKAESHIWLVIKGAWGEKLICKHLQFWYLEVRVGSQMETSTFRCLSVGVSVWAACLSCWGSHWRSGWCSQWSLTVMVLIVARAPTPAPKERLCRHSDAFVWMLNCRPTIVQMTCPPLWIHQF